MSILDPNREAFMKKTALSVLVLLATACGSSSKPSDAGATGGVSGTGGGAGGSGGSTGGTGAATGGGGGWATGGQPGNSDGSAGGDAGVARDGGPDAADARPDVASADSGAAPGDGGSGQSLDQCFADLRPLMRTYQLATKASADGKTRVRLALEVPDGTLSTPGTVGWAFLRFGVEHEGVTSCVTQPAQLHYKGTLHNCKDTATVDVGARTVDVVAPDRETSQVSSSAGGALVWGPVTVTNTTCLGARSNTPGACTSGGPCL
jgi:hypothetical protein